MYGEYQLINISVYKIHIYAQITHHMQWLPHAGMVKKHIMSDFKAKLKFFWYNILLMTCRTATAEERLSRNRNKIF
jgi:hypothetical protein